MPRAPHHLILVRAGDPELSGSIGCCCRIGRDDIRWDRSGPSAEQADPRLVRFGEAYRALRAACGARVEITVLDPRNVLSLVALVARDALRFGVPPRAALRAMTAASTAAAVLDGRLLFRGTALPVDSVLAMVDARIAAGAAAGPSGELACNPTS